MSQPRNGRRDEITTFLRMRKRCKRLVTQCSYYSVVVIECFESIDCSRQWIGEMSISWKCTNPISMRHIHSCCRRRRRFYFELTFESQLFWLWKQLFAVSCRRKRAVKVCSFVTVLWALCMACWVSCWNWVFQPNRNNVEQRLAAKCLFGNKCTKITIHKLFACRHCWCFCSMLDRFSTISSPHALLYCFTLEKKIHLTMKRAQNKLFSLQHDEKKKSRLALYLCLFLVLVLSQPFVWSE